uniref:Uncharacterized protein n=1 Tax=Salmo trutta TaxID=8032 RepID=A0A674DBA0_SALTR
MQSWTCLFLIICSMQSVCHCCDWIRHHYGHLSSEYLSLLDQMGGDITEQDAPVFFPTLLYRHIDEAKVKTRIMTYHVLICFSIAVTWDKKKLDDFLNILERQLENLNSCVSPAKKPERRLKRYFKELNRKVLRKMVSSVSYGNMFNTSNQMNIN